MSRHAGPDRWRRMSFWFGLVLNEVPFLGIYAVVASTALAAAQGDLESPGAKATAAVAARHHRRAGCLRLAGPADRPGGRAGP